MSKLKEIPQLPSNPQKLDKNMKGFSTALLFDLSPLRSNINENPELPDNLKLNSSNSAVQGESSSVLNDFLSSDLIQKINQLSPISSSEQRKSHISDVCLVNCKDNISSNDEDIVQSDLLSCSSSESLELKEDSEMQSKMKKKANKVTIGVSSMIDNTKKENSTPDDIEQKEKKESDIKLNKSYNDIEHILDKEKIFLPKLNKYPSNSKQDDDNKKDITNGNSQNRSRIFSYYDSTSKYLSQALQEDQEKDNNSKMRDSINNSHNYIPKSNVVFGVNNSSNNLSNSEISINNNPFKGENFSHVTDSPNKPFFNKSINSNNQYDFQNNNNNNTNSNTNNNQNFFYDHSQNNEKLNTYNSHSNIFNKDDNKMKSNFYYNYMSQMLQPQNEIQNANITNKQNYFPCDSNVEQEEIEFPCFPQGNFNFTNQMQNMALFQQNDNKKNNTKKIKKKVAQKKKANEQEDQNDTQDNPSEYLLEMFGRVGWICNQCNNFNYETRVKCNRCGINKNPKKLSEIKKKKENDKDKKKSKDHKGDWICPNCQNLNFGFRKLCNRCQIPRELQQNVIEISHGIIQNLQKQRMQMEQNFVNPFLFQRNFPMQLVNNGHINNNITNINNNYQEK